MLGLLRIISKSEQCLVFNIKLFSRAGEDSLLLLEQMNYKQSVAHVVVKNDFIMNFGTSLGPAVVLDSVLVRLLFFTLSAGLKNAKFP